MKCEFSDRQKIKCFRDIAIGMCKMGNDLVIEAGKEYITFRTVNDLGTALPVIRFNEVFFDGYEYLSNDEQIIYEVTSKWLEMALKCFPHLVDFKMEILTDSFQLCLTLVDCNEIEHVCTLNLQSSDLPVAAFDYSKINVSLICRNDIFFDVKKAFNGCNSIYLELNRISKNRCLIISSPDIDKELHSCKLFIQRNEKCDPIFSNDSTVVKLSISALEFKQCLSLCSFISQKISLFLIESGYPIMVKASMDKRISFEMSIATAFENKGQTFINNNNPIISIPDNSPSLISKSFHYQ